MKWITLPLCLFSAHAFAADAYITLVSDYRAYGISQTGRSPTAQAGVDWTTDLVSGAYLSLWGSGVLGSNSKAKILFSNWMALPALRDRSLIQSAMTWALRNTPTTVILSLILMHSTKST